MKREQIHFILEGLKLTMECNYFWYRGEYYVQTKGVAMGVKYAPSVANLFMNKWEDELYSKSYHKLSFTNDI